MARPNKRTKTNCGQDLQLEHDPLPVMEEMWRQGQLCDVVLRAKGRQFGAHRVVLASAIPYFRAMFTGEMVEASNKETELKDIDAIALEALINFAYTGRLNLEEGNVQSIMMGANYLQLETIRDACSDYLLQRIDSQNALGVERLARFLGCTTLADAAGKYVERNFHDVYKHEEYLTLSATEVEELLDNDNLTVSGEEQVFEACMLWVKQSADERKEHLARLLAAVRLPLLTSHFIVDRVRSEALIRSSPPCRDLVKEALDFHSFPERRRSPMPKSSFKTDHRLGDLHGRIYACSEEQYPLEHSVSHYDVRTNQWTMLTVPGQRLYPGIAVHDGKLYMFGGVRDIKTSEQVYDLVKEEWSTVSPMLSERRCMGVAAQGDHIYVCGGWNMGTMLNSVERYHPGTDSWRSMAPMNTARWSCAAISYLGFIYVLGGSLGRGRGASLASVERYDPVRNTWSKAPPMLTPRGRLGVAVLGDKLYACGVATHDSRSDQRTVEVFHPQTNRWYCVASTNEPLGDVTLAAHMGKLWAVSRLTPSDPWIVEVYDPSINVWTVVYKGDQLRPRRRYRD